LLRACLANIPIYLMSAIKFPRWAIEAINSKMDNFFWNDQENSHKYHLSNIISLTQEKEFGGLGILNLRDLNLSLLDSLVQRYHDGEGKLWKAIIDFKYTPCSSNIFGCRNRDNPPSGKGLCGLLQILRCDIGGMWVMVRRLYSR
jgi:hypothetical protein